MLSGQGLQDAHAWAEGKSLSVQDYQFLAASQKKTQKQTHEILNQIVWELVSPLSVDKVSPQVANLIKRLQQVSGDDSLTLLKIKAGSTILILQGSQEGFERIRVLWNTGQLTEILGIPVQDMKYAASEHQTTVSRARELNVVGGSQQVITEVIPKESLGERLDSLVAEACKHPAGSFEHQKNLTRIIRLVAPKLWRENRPYYQDALQQTWVYFCQNICEGKTGKAYDRERSSIITWLNFYLKRRLQDFYIDDRNRKEKFVSKKADDSTETLDSLENIAIQADVPPLLEALKQWVETDPDGELSSIHIANRPDVTAQVLILRRLPPEKSWKELAAEFNLSIATLSTFYQRHCLPRLRKFGKAEGYL